jgi:branched-chain amino acid transport system substrate-binding protein
MTSRNLMWTLVACMMIFFMPVSSVFGQTGKPIEIGLVNSVTGEAASTGIYVQRGVELAIEEWNNKGGVNGQKIKLITEDDTGQAAGAVNAFSKLVKGNKPIVALLPNYSVMVMAIMPYLADAGVPSLTGATNPKITTQGNQWIFRFRTNDAIMAKLIAEYATKVSDKIALIHDTNEFGRGGAEALKETLAAMKIVPLVEEGYNTGDKNFTAQLLNIQKSGAKVLLGWGHPLENGLIMKQLKEMGINIQLIGAAPYGHPVALNLAKDAAEHVMFAQEYTAFDKDPAVQEFAKKYQQKYKQVSEFNAATYYDATNLILETIQKYKPNTSKEMQEALEKVKDFKGVCGTFAFDNNHEGFRKAVIVKIANGTPEVVEKIELPMN